MLHVKVGKYQQANGGNISMLVRHNILSNVADMQLGWYAYGP